MPGRKKQTNRVLILITILLCLIFGVLFTQSSTSLEPNGSSDSLPAVIIADENDAGEERLASDAEEKSSQDKENSPDTEKEEASKKATDSQWIFVDNQWYCLRRGKPLTGWQTLDSHTYYFNKKGILQTGWLKYNGKKYYLDEDGILMHGWVQVDGKLYYLQEDGSLNSTVTKKGKTTGSFLEVHLSSSDFGDSKQDSTDEKKSSSDKKSSSKNSTGQKKKSASEKAATASVPGTVSLPEAPEGAKIALTFDDGPGIYTDRLLDALEKNNAKATFFMVGKNISDFPDTISRMEQLGCELGNHTYSHKDLTSLSEDELRNQVEDVNYSLNELLGHGAGLVRPPYGSVNDTVRQDVSYPLILWSLDTEDWKTLDTQTTVRNVFEHVTDGDIVLMHDIHEPSVAAAEILIPELIKKGYQLVTVSELAQDKGIALEAGQVYGSMDTTD